jgi:transposase InsO family protein
MSSKKKSSGVKEWKVADKLEAVQMKQRGLMIKDIKAIYHISNETLYKWVHAYERNGIAGLEQTSNRREPGEPSVKVQVAEQIIKEIRQAEPQGGVGKAQGALYRHGFLSLARETVRKLLRRTGTGPVIINPKRRNKPAAVKQFERATPNEMWQTDIMSFMIKGQYRVYLIGFMDDHSRFLLGWGLYRFQTAANVQEVFRAAIEKHGMPKEVLSDNGRQYYTWRGKSAFTTMLTKLGIGHIRSRPYHPQTLGKIESFWRNLYQECLSHVPLASFEEAQEKMGTYIEYYNFKRPHQGIGNVTPSDRFYRVAGQVKHIIEQNTARVDEEKRPLVDYTPPVYLVGNLGGKELRVVAQAAEVSLRDSEVACAAGRTDENGGCPDMAGGENVQPGSRGVPSFNGEEMKNGVTDENEASESVGAVGLNPSGNGAEAADPGVMPTGGSLTGTVLPVDETGEASGAPGVGGEGPGTEDGNGESVPGNPETEGASEAIGEASASIAPGAGPSEIIIPCGAADYPSAGVGSNT